MKKYRRFKSFLECLFMCFLGFFWGYYEWEYLGKMSYRTWKTRLKLIIKDKNFIL